VIIGLFVSLCIAFVVFMVVVPAVLGGVAILVVCQRPRRPGAVLRVSDAVAHPGWYPDPMSPGVVRYFDGQSWTSFTAHSQGAQ
jgi:hypothetical protein